jgi:hypothetical protein
MTADRLLLWLVRFNGAVLLCAAPFALVPFAWMDAIHRDALGLGSLADAPITRYMARSLALLYATCGLCTLLITLDWERYRPAAPVLAWLHVGFGGAILLVDLDAGMPWWWTACEGPPLVVMGLLMLALYLRAERKKQEAHG